jgi:hypothetical protein
MDLGVLLMEASGQWLSVTMEVPVTMLALNHMSHVQATVVTKAEVVLLLVLKAPVVNMSLNVVKF